MSYSIDAGRPLLLWVIRLGSVGIVLHLLAVLVVVFAAQSGPWPSPFGPSPQEPPAFVWQRNAAGKILNDLAFGYLQPLHLDSNFHFSSNHTEFSAVRFEAHVKEPDGTETTLSFPEKDANFWVRHRQSLLAQSLGGDESVQSRLQNTMPASGRIERLAIWARGNSDHEFVLRMKPVTAFDQTEQQTMGPSEWSQQLAQSYVRYLRRKTNAEHIEIIRYSREQIPPVVLLAPPEAWPPNLFNDMVADFTERQP
jgi:hypothetical protein